VQFDRFPSADVSDVHVVLSAHSVVSSGDAEAEIGAVTDAQKDWMHAAFAATVVGIHEDSFEFALSRIDGADWGGAVRVDWLVLRRSSLNTPWRDAGTVSGALHAPAFGGQVALPLEESGANLKTVQLRFDKPFSSLPHILASAEHGAGDSHVYAVSVRSVSVREAELNVMRVTGGEADPQAKVMVNWIATAKLLACESASESSDSWDVKWKEAQVIENGRCDLELWSDNGLNRKEAMQKCDWDPLCKGLMYLNKMGSDGRQATRGWYQGCSWKGDKSAATAHFARNDDWDVIIKPGCPDGVYTDAPTRAPTSPPVVTPSPTPVPDSGCTGVYEAEDAILNGIIVSQDATGFSGRGFAQFRWPMGDAITFILHSCHEGAHSFTFRHALDKGSRALRVLLNERVVFAELEFPSTKCARLFFFHVMFSFQFDLDDSACRSFNEWSATTTFNGARMNECTGMSKMVASRVSGLFCSQSRN
jgi:hypothetical protein